MFRDSEYVMELINGFFQQKEIIKRFEVIENNRISGWEIWLQIEFSYFLSNHPTNPEWYREESYEYDRRQEKIKLRLKPDFLIRKSGWAKDQYMALEFKQNIKALTCFKNMLEDLEKFRKIKNSSNDLRSIWCVGVFHSEDVQNAYDSISKYLESEESNFSLEDIVFGKIGKTNHWYMIL